MRLNYTKLRVVDGDTVRVLWQGLAWYVRIVGLDCDELGTRRGVEQKELLESLANRWWFKPKLIAQVSKSHDGWPYLKHHNGRFLCRMYVFRWWRYVDYGAFMKSKQQVKRGSQWNL